MTKTDQFAIVDPHTIKVTFPIKSKLSLPDFAVPLAIIYNSKVAKAHATATDPVGGRISPSQHRRVRRLQGRSLGSRPAACLHPQRSLEGRSRAGLAPGDPPRDPQQIDPPRALVERGDVHIDLTCPARMRRS